jgi:hypothetical protein
MQELQLILQQAHINPNASDRWSYIWGSGDFLTRKAYLQIIRVNDESPIFRWMWKSCVRGKQKFFFWLPLKD